MFRGAGSSCIVERLPGQLVIITGGNGIHGEIWFSDGTAAGTQLIQTHPSDLSSSVYLVNDQLVYGVTGSMWALPYSSPLTQKTYLPSITQ